MIGDFHVFVRDDSVVADVPAELASGLARTFDSLVFSEDVQVADESEGLRQFEVAGPQAPQALGTAFDLEAAALRALPLWAQLDVPGGFVARTDEAGEGSWDVVVGSAAADRAVAALESAGAVRMSNELVEALRIDAGTPTFGVDMTSETIPLEAGLLDRAISQTKGCYPGQEVIVRVLHRGGGRVARRLVRVELGEGAAVPAAGDSVPVESGDTGRVTSAAWSPRLGRPVALAYVGRGV
jgi:folate-binding protein YgfZ